MKSVMLSIKPEYCELIVLGLKTVELRKTKPKIETPFKCYIYQSKTVYVSKNKTNEFLKPIQDKRFGKVIGEFVCDKIFEYEYFGADCSVGIHEGYAITDCTKLNINDCLTNEERLAYGKGKPLYGWHISDLIIYNEPKELSEFGKECNLDCPSVRCPYWKYQRVNADEWDYDCSVGNFKPLTRPPQSWCYVEEVRK